MAVGLAEYNLVHCERNIKKSFDQIIVISSRIPPQRSITEPLGFSQITLTSNILREITKISETLLQRHPRALLGVLTRIGLKSDSIDTLHHIQKMFTDRLHPKFSGFSKFPVLKEELAESIVEINKMIAEHWKHLCVALWVSI